MNEATIQATGRSREELIGTPFADYFTDSEKAHKGVMMVFQTGEVRDYELVMKAKDGTQTFVSYNASVYKDQTGDVVGAFAAARDITERKQAEVELQKLNHELEENIEDLERTIKAFTGREIRMAELKEQIAELEKDAELYKKAGDKTT